MGVLAMGQRHACRVLSTSRRMVARELEYPGAHGARAQDWARDLQAAAVSRTRRQALCGGLIWRQRQGPQLVLEPGGKPRSDGRAAGAHRAYRARTLGP